ncbi:MAG: LptM family lipoprotein [Actinomycetota bacterium]
MRKRMFLLLIVGFVVVTAACGTKGPASSPKPSTEAWGDQDAGVYATTIGVVVDEIGTGPPPVVFVVDRLCTDAGQVIATKLSCNAAIPTAGKSALSDAMLNVAPVEFVRDPSSVVGSDGSVARDGLLVWLGPTKDEKSDVRVGANYQTRASVKEEGAINLRMAWRHAQWVVTGSAGLGGCPA